MFIWSRFITIIITIIIIIIIELLLLWIGSLVSNKTLAVIKFLFYCIIHYREREPRPETSSPFGDKLTTDELDEVRDGGHAHWVTVSL